MAAELANRAPSNLKNSVHYPSSPQASVFQQLMERLQALEQSVQQIQVDQKEREEWNSQHLHNIEKQLEVSSPRSPGFAYSTLQKKPVPSVFQMPLHYPRYKKSDYETMPEWKVDRLLEEYGLPVLGSLREKRQYAMGVFLWKDQRG